MGRGSRPLVTSGHLGAILAEPGESACGLERQTPSTHRALSVFLGTVNEVLNGS